MPHRRNPWTQIDEDDDDILVPSTAGVCIVAVVAFALALPLLVSAVNSYYS